MAVEIFSTVTPIKDGGEAPLRGELARFEAVVRAGGRSPLADVPGTHAGRWVVMDQLGTGDRTRRRRLRPAQLLFSALVDGPVDAWLWGLFEKQSAAAERVWRHCTDWPAEGDGTAARARWLVDHRLVATFPFIARDATVRDVERGLALRNALARLAPAVGTLSPREIRDAYDRLPAR
jgi:hypothetical protein